MNKLLTCLLLASACTSSPTEPTPSRTDTMDVPAQVYLIDRGVTYLSSPMGVLNLPSEARLQKSLAVWVTVREYLTNDHLDSLVVLGWRPRAI
jgi:hypothetical protein